MLLDTNQYTNGHGPTAHSFINIIGTNKIAIKCLATKERHCSNTKFYSPKWRMILNDVDNPIQFGFIREAVKSQNSKGNFFNKKKTVTCSFPNSIFISSC